MVPGTTERNEGVRKTTEEEEDWLTLGPKGPLMVFLHGFLLDDPGKESADDERTTMGFEYKQKERQSYEDRVNISGGQR